MEIGYIWEMFLINALLNKKNRGYIGKLLFCGVEGERGETLGGRKNVKKYITVDYQRIICDNMSENIRKENIHET